jgi:hypothetical protein
VKKCKEYIDTMILNRDQLVTRLQNRNDNMVRVPVAFQYIITNIQGQLNLTNASSTDITPMEAFELIEEYYTKLETIGFMTSNSLQDPILLLPDEDLITKRRFHKDLFSCWKPSCLNTRRSSTRRVRWRGCGSVNRRTQHPTNSKHVPQFRCRQRAT